MWMWIIVACGPKAVTEGPGASAADYLPLTPGAVWSYEAVFNGRTMAEDRTVIELDTVSGPAFAFVEVDDVGDRNIHTFTGSFGLGAYRLDGDDVLTADAGWQDDFSSLTVSDFEPMLPPLQIGQQITYDTPSLDRSGTITVEAFEDVTVPAGTFPRSVRLHLGKESYAWLAPGVGLVKWVYVTGREESLTAFTPAQ